MINIVTALQCEAKPLIQHFKLKGLPPSAGFKVYEGEQMRLIITGLGKIACASGCAYLFGRYGDRQNEAWLNLGVAGHGQREVGELVLAQKITDANQALSWYPPLVFSSPCSRDNLTTLDQPSENYDPQACFDMEASAFYLCAVRWSSAELVQVIKIISDNPQQPSEHVNESMVTGLIDSQMDGIKHIISELQQLSRELQSIEASPSIFEDILTQWRFSRYQQNQLQQLLLRWQALVPESPIQLSELDQCRGSKAVIEHLTQRLNQCEITF